MTISTAGNTPRQMPLQGVPAGPGARCAAGRLQGQDSARERVTVDLRGLAPRLRAYAAANGRTLAAAIRLALMQALDGEPADESPESSGVPVPAKTIKITLRVSAKHAACLARRARASDISQGGYVCVLLDGDRPSPLPADHDAAIGALMRSTDHLAVLSADLNGFVRLVGTVPNPELQRYRASVVSVVEDVRKHLARASALIAEIRAARRGRR